MEKTIKLVSSSLSSLNSNLQNLTLNEKISEFTPVIVEANGKFTSIIKTDDNFDPSSLNSNVDIEDNEKTKETKQQLLNQATDTLKQTLENSKQLDNILNRIKELAKETGNEWVVNKYGNTASLANKNAYIFKQNDYLCLSHSGKIELFKSVKELRDWLKDNSYPLPTEDVVIHESVKEATDKEETGRDWYDLLLNRTDDEINNYDKNSNYLSKKIKDTFEKQILDHDAKKNSILNSIEDLNRSKKQLELQKSAAESQTNKIIKKLVNPNQNLNDEQRNELIDEKDKLLQASYEIDDQLNEISPLLKNLLAKHIDSYSEIHPKEKEIALKRNKLYSDLLSKNKQNKEYDPLEIGLGKRIDKKDYQGTPEKEINIIDKSNIEFEDEENVEECFGGGITGVANLGSAVSFLGNKKTKDDLHEKAEFLPGQMYDQWGKAANSLFNPATLAKIKSGEVSIPANVVDLFYGAQIAKMGYDLKAKTSDGWNKCTAYGLRKEAEKLIQNPTNDFKKQCKVLLSDPAVNGLDTENKKKAILEFAMNYVKNNPTAENLSNISKILNDYVVYYKATGKELKTGLNKSMNDMLYQSIVDPIVNKYLESNPEESENFIQLQFGDNISYDKTNDDSLVKKYIISKTGSTENRLKWQTYFYSAQKSFEKQVEALYDAIFGTDSHVKIDKTPNEALHAYVAKNIGNTTLAKELTDEDKKKLKINNTSKEKPEDKKSIKPSNSKFSDEDIELLKSKNIDINDFDEKTIKKFLALLRTSKLSTESTTLNIQESASKYPWLNKIIGTRLVEDDTPADFATGQPVIDDLNSIGDTSSSETTTDTTTTDIPDVDLNTSSDNNKGYDDIDINFNGNYDPEDAEQDQVSVPGMPDYKVVDVLMDNDDPDNIKVKVENQDTKQTEFKDLEDIDV